MDRAAWRTVRTAGFALALAAVLAAGVALRFHALDRQSLWQDEIHTAIYVTDHPSLWTVIHRVATWDLHAPLYYVLLWMEVQVQGPLGVPLTDGNLRILSALLGALSLPVIYLLAFGVFRERGWAWFALFLAALNSYGIFYSQELRMYAAILFLSPLVLYFRLRLWSEGRLDRRMAAGFVASAVLLLYSSLIGTFFVAGVWASVLLISWAERKDLPHAWKEALWLGGIVVACYLPWLGVMWRQSQVLKGGVDTGLVITAPRELFKFSFENLLFHSWKAGSGYDLISKLVRLLVPLSLLNLLDRERRREHVMVLVSFAGVFIIYYIVTYGRPFHTGRYFSPWWPYVFYFVTAAFSGAALLLKRLGPAGLGAGIALATVFGGAYARVQADQLRYYFTAYEKENWRAAVPRLNAVYAPGDHMLVAGDWARRNFEYYGLRHPCVPAADLGSGKLPEGLRRLYYMGRTNPASEKDLGGYDLPGPFREVPWPGGNNVYEWKLFLWEPALDAAGPLHGLARSGKSLYHAREGLGPGQTGPGPRTTASGEAP
jgi:hypothetical protein